MSRSGAWVARGAALGALAFALVTLLVGINEGAPLQFLILDTTLGVLFIAAGWIAWEGRPDVPTGPLLTLSGVLWFVGSYAPTSLEPHSALGWSFERYYDFVLAYMALSFPGRRPASRLGLVLVLAMATAYLLRTAFRLAFVCGCLPAPLAGLGDEAAVAVSDAVASTVAVVLVIGVAVLIARHAIDATPAAKRILRPVATAGIIAALAAAYDNAELALGRITGLPLNDLPEPWREVVAWTIIGSVALVPLGFLLGTLRLRLRHGAIAPLAIEIDRHTDPVGLERALQHALGDPSLRLFIRDDAGTWRDSSNVAAQPPAEAAGRAVTRLTRDGEDMAALMHDEALREDPGLVGAATAVLRLAVENERLTADVRAQLEEVRASRARLVEAAQVERTRIERDLHDGAQQRLVGVALMLQEALTQARRESPHAGFVQRLDETSEELQSAIDELRELARGIHPALLSEEGLGVAVAALARRSSVPVELDITLDRRLPPAIEATGYYVVAEALTNVTRHARARLATVSVNLNGGSLHIEVADDGQGGTDSSRGTGLRGLADRLEAISGRLEVDSPVGGGTRLRAVIPCA